jgi:hypothetical protein
LRLSCTKCGSDKPETAFDLRTDKGVTRRRRQCKECLAPQRNKTRPGRKRQQDKRVKRPGLVKNRRSNLPDGSRQCIRCDRVKPETGEFFGRGGDRKYSSWCRECGRLYARDRASQRRADPVERSIVLSEKKRHAKSEKGRKWKRERSLIDNAMRRQRHTGRPFQWTSVDWKRCCADWNNHCAYCESCGPLTKDHFIPVSSSDFPGTIPGNVLPACGPCNYGKQHRDPHEWLSDKSRLERILSYLRAERLRTAPVQAKGLA